MKRILLLVVTISLFAYVTAQENTWDVYLQGQAVKSIAFEDDNVWAATDGFLVRLNKTDLSTTYYSYPFIDENGDSYKLKIDKNGVKWLARSEYLGSGHSIYESYDSGIYSFDGNQWKNVKSLGYGEISSLAIDKKNHLWIAAMWNNGLYKIEQDDSCIQYTPENSDLVYDFVAQVASDKNGNIWVVNYGNVNIIGADLALMKYDGDQWSSFLYGRGVFLNTYIAIDAQDNPWIEQHLFEPPISVKKFDVSSSSWTDQINLNVDSISPLQAIDAENRFWFTNKYGIAVYDGSDWSYYTTANSVLPSDTINQIAIDDDGTKWIATDQGLAVFNENGLLSTVNYSEMMNDIVLFPNPAKDVITLKMPEGLQNLTVDIFNIQGRTMKSFTVNNNQNQVDVSAFPSGIYLVRIQSDENYTVKKFVKQ